MDVDQLTLRDLRLEAELSKKSKAAVPVMETQKDMPTDIINSVVSDLNLKDLGIEEQLQKISRNAVKDVYGWKPSLIKSDVTNAMIQDYQDEVANSFYDDPITGKKFKYVPSSSDITLEEYTPQDTLESKGISEEEIRARQRTLAAARKAYEQQIVDETERLEYIKGTVEFQEQARVKGFYNKEFLRANPDLAITTESGYLDYVQRLENEIFGFKARIFEIDAELADLAEMLQQNERVKSENQANKARVDQANYRTLQTRSEELNLLNRGKLNLERQPNESDQDFQQRLIDVGQVEFDEEAITDQAGRRAVSKFKENMKTISRNNTLAENMIKSVDPSRLFLYNKYFSAIQSKMKEVFGATTFKEDDFRNLLGIFDNIIGKVSLEPAEQAVAQQVYQAEPYFDLPNVPSYGSPYSEIPDFVPLAPSYESVFADSRFASSREQAPIGRQVITASSDEQQTLTEERQRAAERKRAGLSTTPEEQVVKAPREPFEQRWVPKQGRSDAQDVWESTSESLTKQFGGAYQSITGQTLTGSKLERFQKVYNAGLIEPPFFQRLQREQQVGVGLQHEKLPRFAHLGKIAIDPHALYYQNTLKVLSHNKHHFLGYKNTKVSEDFVSILMDLLKGKFPTGHELKKLDLHEKELYDNIIHLAHLHKKAEHNLPQTRQSMKHRFELLNGEIGAGNTNKSIKAELKQLVHKMAHGGMISHVQAWKYLKSI